MDNVNLYAPITKKDPKQRMVYGYASTEAMDSQGEVVKLDALKEAMNDYMKWANVREMHQPSAVGKTKEATIDARGMYVGIKVVDPHAWEKVEEGVYNGFSIGGRVKTMQDNEITAMVLSEISLVDRPANPECKFDVYKVDNIDMEKKKVAVKEEVKTVEVQTVVEPIKEEVKEVPAVEVKEEIKEEVAEVKVEDKNATEVIVDAPVDEIKPEVKVDKVKEEVKEEKLDKPEIKKSLYDVARFAEILENLHDLEQWMEFDGEMEGDDPKNKEFTDKLSAELKVLGDLLVARTQKEVDEASKEEVDETKAEKTIFEKCEELVLVGKMPDEDMIKEVCKASGLEPSQKNMDAVKWELSGKILNAVSKSIHDATYIAKADVPTQAPNESMSAVLDKLNELVRLISQSGVDHAVNMAGGVKAGSERTSEHTDEKPEDKQNKETDILSGKFDAQAEVEKVDLAKVEALIMPLKEQVEKMMNTPMPIKAKASYVAVEKFEGAGGSETLAKAEKEVDELSKQLKDRPYDSALVEKANKLSTEIMRLRREAKKIV